MEQRLPADVVGKMRQSAAAQRLGHAHIVVAGLGRRAPHLADKTLQFVGESPVLAIEPARILEQVAVPVMTRQYFLASKVDQPVTHRADFFRQFPCNRGHRAPPTIEWASFLQHVTRGTTYQTRR